MIKEGSIPYPMMLIIVATVSYLDTITTYLILSSGGVEANSFMASYYQNPLLLILIKTSFVLIIYGMSAFIERRIAYGGWIIVGLVSLVTSFAIISNVIMLLLHG